MAPVSDYSTTPADNTSVSGLDVSDSTPVNTIDNIIRQIMADIRAADDQNIKLTGNQTATGTKTFGSAVAGSMRVTAASAARLTLQDTTATDTFEQTRIIRDGTTFKIETADNTGTNVANDYVATIGASGATAHQFNITGTAAARITDGTIALTGTFPQVILDETDGTSTHRKVSLFKNGDSFQIRTLSSTDTSPSTDFVMVMGASGATSHSFRVQTTERLLINSSGCTSLAFTPTSDARIKDNIRDLNEIERRAAAKIKARTYTLKENGQRKIGYVAQEIIEAMASEGLDAFEYGLVIDGPIYAVDYDAVNAFRMG